LAYRSTTIALEMVVPIVAGYWLDQRLGTGVVFAALGAIIGLTLGMWSLVQIARPPRRGNAPDRKDPEHR